MTYEQLCADLTGTTLEALEFLGLEPRLGCTIGPSEELTKQADSLSEEWITRYRELAAD